MNKEKEKVKKERFTTTIRKDTKRKLAVVSAEKGYKKQSEFIEDMVDEEYEKLKKGE